MRQSQSLLALFGLAASVKAQKTCSLNAEGKPNLSWSSCTSGGGCTSTTSPVVIDANWRWAHTLTGTTNCYTGNTWNTSICTSNAACAENCCLDGSGGYQSTYGVSTSGNALNLQFVTKTQYANNVGNRVYLMNAAGTEYEMFNLNNKEFTFDTNIANLPCGLNGAVYFVSMDADGGLSKYPDNKAGAPYGTGYCDVQCAKDLKWINGAGNVAGWSPDSNDPNSGVGVLGSCCNEVDIFEANSISNALTLHSCTTTEQEECSGANCGGTYATNRYGGKCDPDGCDINPYRNGATSFYGPGKTVDTSKVFTVVTQFLTDASGTLNEVKRFYVQNGVLIGTPYSTNIAGGSYNSITADYCVNEHASFNETDYFTKDGGFSSIQKGWANGMVLVMSLWDDHAVNMLWLDSILPTDSTAPGAARGSCAITSGAPTDVETNHANANVIYSNLKVGDINSTFTYTSVLGGGSGAPPPPPPPSSSSKAGSSTKVSASTTTTKPVVPTSSKTTTTTTTTVRTTTTTAPPSNGGGAAHWGQCGGIGYSGPTGCSGGYTCSTINPYYYQCL